MGFGSFPPSPGHAKRDPSRNLCRSVDGAGLLLLATPSQNAMLRLESRPTCLTKEATSDTMAVQVVY